MADPDYNLYWGEIHTHTFCYGPEPYGTIEDAAGIARSHLDFWATAEHYNYVKGQKHHPFFDWGRISRVIRESYAPGKFVTFPGFEFVGEDGDYNLYFAGDISFLPEIQDYQSLFALAKKESAIAIPHHTGYKVGCRGMRWDWFEPSIMPLVEIFSMHGSSEDDRGAFPLDIPWMGPREAGGTVLKGLLQGHIFGFIASSDGHNAYPGSYKMGLAAVYAKDLTRESIWSAFRARRTYAVTGDRIKLKFEINGRPMGSILPLTRNRNLSITADGLDALDRIEIIKNGRIILRDNASLNPDFDSSRSGRFKIRIEWGWGPAEPWQAEGELAVREGSIVSCVPCFGPPGPNRLLSASDGTVKWGSRTVGRSIFDWRIGRYAREGTNSVVFNIRGDGRTVLELRLNQRRFCYSLAELMDGSRVELMGDWNEQKVKFHQPVPENQYHKSLTVTDTAGNGSDRDFYYVRITQANGQMAWSSPVWVEGK